MKNLLKVVAFPAVSAEFISVELDNFNLTVFFSHGLRLFKILDQKDSFSTFEIIFANIYGLRKSIPIQLNYLQQLQTTFETIEINLNMH